jgi:hypothetical protein
MCRGAATLAWLRVSIARVSELLFHSELLL